MSPRAGQVLPLALALLASTLACAHGRDAAGAREAVVAQNLPELQDCWDDLAPAHPGTAGSLLFSVELRRNGSVEWVELQADELGIPKLSACTVRRIKRWRFPEDRRPRTIQFGIGFTSG